MPVIFTFMLATFPAGLVIYWAWNNSLSIIQQGVIMKRQGAKIELWDNLIAMFKRETVAGRIAGRYDCKKPQARLGVFLIWSMDRS